MILFFIFVYILVIQKLTELMAEVEISINTLKEEQRKR